MDNNQIASLLTNVLIFMICILFVLVVIWIFIKLKSNNSSKNTKENADEKGKNKSKIQAEYNIESIFNFMEFDKIEDNMIIQKDGKRFLMVIKCQGINYDLMSGVEKTSVEQGFIQYLNTLRNPIQIYVQTRTVDLTGSLSNYKTRVRNLGSSLTQKEFEYNQKVRSQRYDKQTLGKEQFEVEKARNLYEYGMDIVNNTERMSLNRNILSKQYYIIMEHTPEEAFNNDYASEEVRNIAFSELYTRAQSTISLLSVCGINGKILDSMELADLLYTAYNRDEAEVYDLKKAINLGYDNMYVTAPDVLEKRMEELDKQIERDAIEKANELVYKVKNEQEKEKKLKRKEKDYNEVVDRMVELILEENQEYLGETVVEKAKEKITKNKDKKINSESKEELTNEQKETKRAGRPRRTA